MPTPDDLSDNELDALFQRGAAAYPELDGQEGWQRMETRLHTEAQHQHERTKVVRLFAAETLVLVLLLLGSFYTVDNLLGSGKPLPNARQTAADNAAPLQNTPTASPLPVPTPSSSSAAAASRTGAASDAATATASAPLVARTAPALQPAAAAPTLAAPTATAPAARPGSTAGALGTARHRGVVPLVFGRGEHNQAAAAAPDRALRPQQAAALLPTPTPGAATPLPGGGTSMAEEPARSSVAAAEAATHSTPTPPAVGPDSLAVPAVPSAVAAADSVAPPPRPESAGMPFYRFGVGVLYAPELSTVRFAQATRPGSNVGVLLEYRATARWRITTGLIRSVKLYEARGSDYHPPAHFWTTYYDINEVYANCRILDIPLNVRFDALVRPRYAVFASAGLSTLLMRRETYDYDYYLQGQSVSREWTLVNGSNHPFSVLNLSAGYEHTLGGRWTGQAEPFVKLPLGGVGFGKVKLSSAGIFFSLKYQLLPTPTQPVR